MSIVRGPTINDLIGKQRGSNDKIIGEGDYQNLVGDTSGSILERASGGNDFLVGGGGFYNALYGDAAVDIAGTATGGNDEIRSAENVSSTGYHVVIGDAGGLLDFARGGNDRILWTSGGEAEIYGDAVSMFGNAIGGNDHLRITNLSGSFGVAGDAYEMYESTRGGDDHLEGGTDGVGGGMTSWFGDAYDMYDGAMGGHDVIRGMSGSSGGSPTINSIFGDAYYAAAGVTFGDDRLISGTYAIDVMWGDAYTKEGSGLGGADVFVFEANNGADQIYDFELGHDKIEIKGIAGIETFDDLVVVVSQGANSSTIDFGGGNTVTVIGVTTLTASDFIFT